MSARTGTPASTAEPVLRKYGRGRPRKGEVRSPKVQKVEQPKEKAEGKKRGRPRKTPLVSAQPSHSSEELPIKEEEMSTDYQSAEQSDERSWAKDANEV